MIGTLNATVTLNKKESISSQKNQVYSLPTQGKFYPKYSSYRKRFFYKHTVLFKVIIWHYHYPVL